MNAVLPTMQVWVALHLFQARTFWSELYIELEDQQSAPPA